MVEQEIVEKEMSWLPLGSVVKLPETNILLVVTGRMQKSSEFDDETFDYAGIPFPTGFENSNQGALFNAEDIEKVIFMGYSNVLEQQWAQELSKAKEELGKQDKDARA